MKLTINLCTRDRPALLVNTLNKTLPNIKDNNTCLMVSIDDDDEKSVAVAKQYGDDILLNIKPREDSLGEKFNRALEAPADVYLYMVDYAPILTKGFDQLVLDAACQFPDGVGCVYTNMANATFPATQAVTAKLAEFMGFIYPPYFPYWFIDHWVDEVVRMIDRIVYADVKMDHWTHRPGQTTGMREPEFWAAFFDACHGMRRATAEKIIFSHKFQELGWRRKLLRRNFPLIEQRSQWINNFVRAEAYNIEKSRGEQDPLDERYQRIKAKAVAKMREIVQELETQESAA